MNKKLHKTPSLSIPKPSELVRSRSLAIDQTMADTAFRSPAGFIANDIYLLEKARTKEQFEFIASRLQEVGVKNVDTSKFSDVEMVKAIMPSFVQTPSEIARFADYYNVTFPVTDSVSSDMDDIKDKEKQVVEQQNEPTPPSE